jgi:hypothetical protein
MKREEWVDREIRTMVQGIHRVLGVGNAGEEPVSPLTISADPPEEDDEAAVSLPDDLGPEPEEAAPPAAPPAPWPGHGAPPGASTSATGADRRWPEETAMSAPAPAGVPAG